MSGAAGWARRARSGRRGGRRGATLVELLVAAVIGGLVSTAAVTTGVRVRRSAGAEAERAAARAQLAQAASVLAGELAAATGADTNAADGSDLVEWRDTVLDVRAPIGGGVACAAGANAGGAPTLVVAAGGAAVGWWSAAPRAGDVLVVHDPGALPGATDDRWIARDVRDGSPAAGACGATPFSAAAGGAAPWRLTLDGAALPPTVGAGAPVRVLRRRRYSLYRGGDQLWWLGMRERDAGGWLGVQPLAGPFDAPALGGMRVLVRDAAGAPLAAGAAGAAGAAAPATVEVHLAAARRWGARAWRDSARVVVRPRGGGGGL